ncbi:MAG TPA: aminotransferase class III-fold pyridoxal phosphate-dependent enzyme, partial [Candidatus Limnocylindrales bacterium]|nr:aminotransferase class III-fold pyridoxal phosphate-dependent enzyme [Candidatus Limnocylindrales bacterium]
YWPAIADVCRRHGVLLVADEVMTGFGRTGRWFAVEHWGVRPDLVAAAKGATSGYWPFGFVAASGAVAETVSSNGFVHGFTYSHHVVGAAVANAVLAILERESLVDASAAKGERLRALLDERLSDHPNVGEVRGRGLMVGIELVADRDTREPFPRAARVAEQIVSGARDAGLLLYSGTANANGIDGDILLLGPPFVVTDDELALIADRTVETIDRVVTAVAADRPPASVAGR